MTSPQLEALRWTFVLGCLAVISVSALVGDVPAPSGESSAQVRAQRTFVTRRPLTSTVGIQLASTTDDRPSGQLGPDPVPLSATEHLGIDAELARLRRLGAVHYRLWQLAPADFQFECAASHGREAARQRQFVARHHAVRSAVRRVVAEVEAWQSQAILADRGRDVNGSP